MFKYQGLLVYLRLTQFDIYPHVGHRHRTSVANFAGHTLFSECLAHENHPNFLKIQALQPRPRMILILLKWMKSMCTSFGDECTKEVLDGYSQTGELGHTDRQTDRWTLSSTLSPCFSVDKSAIFVKHVLKVIVCMLRHRCRLQRLFISVT